MAQPSFGIVDESTRSPRRGSFLHLDETDATPRYSAASTIARERSFPWRDVRAEDSNMKIALNVLIGVAGMAGLSGCGADVNSELLANESEALTGLARGVHRDYDGDGKADILFYNS